MKNKKRSRRRKEIEIEEQKGVESLRVLPSCFCCHGFANLLYHTSSAFTVSFYSPIRRSAFLPSVFFVFVCSYILALPPLPPLTRLFSFRTAHLPSNLRLLYLKFCLKFSTHRFIPSPIYIPLGSSYYAGTSITRKPHATQETERQTTDAQTTTHGTSYHPFSAAATSTLTVIIFERCFLFVSY